MARRLALVLAILAFCSSQIGAQSAATGQDFTFQVSTAQPGAAQAWTDTGLDLQAGDAVNISLDSPASAQACDQATSQPADLPLPSAHVGTLIARLHAHGAPLLVGTGTELKIEEPSHLFLGINTASNSTCQLTLSVKVHKIASSSTGNSASTGDNQQTRGTQLKSQLATAAQVFMQGQFGMGKSESANAGSSNAVSPGSAANTASETTLKVSDAPLDADLRKSIDSLPRRVNDQFENLGDMVNFVIIGNQKDVQAALDAATWHVADTNNERAVLNAVMQTYESKDYLAMPMSTLFLFGRKQDFGYEMAEPIAMVASRHHFRIWKAPFTWKGSEVWVGAGTHDIGFAKDKRNNNVTHKIDPAVDGERDNIGGSLQKANKAKTLTYYLPANPVQDAKNATGDGYHSDGRLLVVFLQ